MVDTNLSAPEPQIGVVEESSPSPPSPPSSASSSDPAPTTQQVMDDHDQPQPSQQNHYTHNNNNNNHNHNTADDCSLIRDETLGRQNEEIVVHDGHGESTSSTPNDDTMRNQQQHEQKEGQQKELSHAAKEWIGSNGNENGNNNYHQNNANNSGEPTRNRNQTGLVEEQEQQIEGMAGTSNVGIFDRKQAKSECGGTAIGGLYSIERGGISGSPGAVAVGPSSLSPSGKGVDATGPEAYTKYHPSTVAEVTRPGAIAVPGKRVDLDSLEQQIHDKVQTTGNMTRSYPGNYDDDLLKTKDPWPSYPSKDPSSSYYDINNRDDTSGGNRRAMEQLEDRIRAKISSQASATSPKRYHGKGNELEQFEDTVRAKQLVWGQDDHGTTTSPGVIYSSRGKDDLYRLENQIFAKMERFQDSDDEGDVPIDRKMPARLPGRALPGAEEEMNATRMTGGMIEMGTISNSLSGKKVISDDGVEKAPDKRPAPIAGMEQSDPGTTNSMYAGTLLDDAELEYGVQDDYDNSEGLAVAFPVNDDEENVFIPSAVQYDPDAKPPPQPNPFFRLYTLIALIAVLVVATAAGVAIAFGRKAVQGPSRTQYRESLGLRELIQSVVGGDVLDDFSTPYARALHWITYNDPMEITPDKPTFYQRYFMAYFYFATTQAKPWRSCNPPDEQAGEDSICTYERLLVPFPIVSRVSVPGSIRWLSKEEECSWVGVRCDEFAQVSEIDLRGMNFTGSFPEGVQHLPFLQSLFLVYGELRGPIPTEVANLKHLVTLEANYNLLTGTIPDAFFNARNLQRIDFAGNRLSGPISSEIKNLRDLKKLYLYQNLLTGSIPDESFRELKSLALLHMQENLLTGTLPASLGFLNGLNILFLYDNRLSGTIPSEWGRAPSLVDVRLYNNEGIKGPIPVELYDLLNAYRFDFFNCNLTGTISERIANVRLLREFRVHNNKLTGSLPSVVGRLTNLQKLSISGNRITGTVPAEVCALRGHDRLAVFEADCLPADDGIVAITCPTGCCTLCCAGQAKACSNTLSGD